MEERTREEGTKGERKTAIEQLFRNKRFVNGFNFPFRLSSFVPSSFCPSPLLAFALSSFLLFSATPAHDYHVSVTQMQYNAGQKIFEVSIKVFTDDLEKGISESNGSRRIIVRNNDSNDAYIESYIRKHFILSASQKKADIKYLGKEQEADATWIYLEIPFAGTTENWRLQNSILMDIFDDQVNMFNIKNGSETKTLLYKKGKSSQLI